MSDLKLAEIVTWAPHPAAAPWAERTDSGALVIAANGTRTCVGGWQVRLTGVTPGRQYSVRVFLRHEGLALVRDSLQCTACWAEMDPTDPRKDAQWEYLLLRRGEVGQACFERELVAPTGASELTLRYTFRWAIQGQTVWQMPEVTEGDPPPARRPVRLCAVTGRAKVRSGPWTIARNLEYYADLCLQACREKPDLVVLPEICLQWQGAGRALVLALELSSPEVEVFRRIAREHSSRIILGLNERDGDAVFNSALLIGPDGANEGLYRKVHLAVLGESDSGVRPGDDFSVFETEIGRIGCNICMDTSAAESSRLLGLNGADIFVMPIMGDHRADRWSPGPPIYSEGRWRAIMRTRAMDNQYAMVIARNESLGSCILDRKGEILAWNEGDQDYVLADVSLDDGYRTWNDGCFRGVNWVQRRPHLYGAFADEENWGNL